MSLITRFDIVLEHDIDEQYQYEPGEDLRGDVILELSGTIAIKAIMVQIKGEANVSWEDSSKKSSPQAYQVDEVYIDVTLDILQMEEGKLVTLDEGRHRFPLNYQLPENLPSSFIGKFGSITYVVKAMLKEDKRFGPSTVITSEPFLVLKRLDIVEDAELQKPVTCTNEKRLFGTLMFCLSGKVCATININRSGHLPGEDIFLDAEITNSSPRLVQSVQAALVMTSVFRAKQKSCQSIQIVNKKRDEWEMDYGEGRRWKNVRLTIPPYIPESRLDGCDIIDIHYELMFKVEISGKNELKINVPLTIGTSNDNRDGGAKLGTYSTDEYIMAAPDVDANGGQANADNVSVDMNEEEAKTFRRPLNHGDVRKNPIFSNN